MGKIKLKLFKQKKNHKEACRKQQKLQEIINKKVSLVGMNEVNVYVCVCAKRTPSLLYV